MGRLVGQSAPPTRQGRPTPRRRQGGRPPRPCARANATIPGPKRGKRPHLMADAGPPFNVYVNHPRASHSGPTPPAIPGRQPTSTAQLLVTGNYLPPTSKRRGVTTQPYLFGRNNDVIFGRPLGRYHPGPQPNGPAADTPKPLDAGCRHRIPRRTLAPQHGPSVRPFPQVGGERHESLLPTAAKIILIRGPTGHGRYSTATHRPAI